MNTKNKNAFLITCISCIVLLLTLCYFGINNSLKGTRAIGVTQPDCNGTIDPDTGKCITSGGEVVTPTCPAGQHLDGGVCKDDKPSSKPTTVSCNPSACGEGTVYSGCDGGKPVCKPKSSDIPCTSICQTSHPGSNYTCTTYKDHCGTICYSCTEKPSGSIGTTTCSAGQYYSGQGKCATCLAGYYCPGGTFNNNDSSRDGITACPSGTTSSAGASTCTSGSSGSSGSSGKTTCPAGQYYSGQGKCATCLAGYYCPGGTFNNSDSSRDGITVCPSGTISDRGSSACTKLSSDSKTCGIDGLRDSDRGYMYVGITCSDGSETSRKEYCSSLGSDYTWVNGHCSFKTYLYKPDGSKYSWHTPLPDGSCQKGYVYDKGLKLCIDQSCNCDNGDCKPTVPLPGGDDTPVKDVPIIPDNPNNPYNPSDPSKPSNPSSSSNPGPSSNVTENPQTGQIAIFIVWAIGLATITYSVWYYVKGRKTN